MVNSNEIDKFLGYEVTAYKECMLIAGILRKIIGDKYIVKSEKCSNYYVFSIEEIKEIYLLNTVMIQLKEK